jgi:hypothetical protein
MKTERISLTISIAAFLVSAITAYFTIFRQSEILEGAVLVPPILEIGAKQLFIRDQIQIAFINSGSRGVAVSSLDITVIQTEPAPNSSCYGKAYATLDIKQDVFVVPRDGLFVVKKTIERTALNSHNSGLLWDNKHTAFVACITVTMLGPLGLEQSSIYFGQYSYDPSSMHKGDADIDDFRGYATTLMHHGITSF